jgi:hypothetical protein
MTGAFQVLFQEFRHKLSLLEQQVSIRGARRSCQRKETMGWLKSLQVLEWRASDRRVVCCVVPVLRQRKPICPLGRRSRHWAAQKHFEALIYPLRLAIRLRMIRGTQVQLSVRSFEQQLLESAGEDLVTIRYNRWRQIVQFYHIVQVHSGYLCCSIRMFQWPEMCVFSIPVNHDQDNRESLWFGKPFDKIHRHCLPRSWRRRHWLQQARCFAVFRFFLLANGTLLHKFIHGHFHALPRKLIFKRWYVAWMPEWPPRAEAWKYVIK